MHAALRLALVPLFASVCASIALAQFNNPWASFVKDTTRIRNPDGSIATQVTTDTQEKDYAWGDLDRDGWIDLVVVRKTAGATVGRLPNQLLMNEGGILVDRTSAYALYSTVPGDLGFATSTCDFDVQIADFNGDLWPDVVTAVALSNTQPKAISHPRVYINKGAAGGVWQGLRYEEPRIPQFLSIPNGLPTAPDFMTVAVGDVTGDGFPDLYFTDANYNAGSGDLNDRLLINDGSGNFVDSLETRMTATMLSSNIGAGCNIADMNGDGTLDVVKLTTPSSPAGVFVSFNNPAAIGTFALREAAGAGGANYALDVGDLNRDGRPDLIVGDDGADYFRLNMSATSASGVAWSANIPYTFLWGSDDGFTGPIHVADLDADGWLDTIHADGDLETIGCARRCHIYHNRGGSIGGTVVLREEAEMPSSAGWKGAVGLLPNELTGTFDVAPFDIDNDGDIDLVFGRCAGTSVWINQAAQPGTISCVGDGSGAPCPCGNLSPVGADAGCLNSSSLSGKLRPTGFSYVTADTLSLVATGVPDNSGLFLQGSSASNVVPFGDGLSCTGGAVIRLGVVFASANTSTYPRPGVDPAISVQGLDAPGDVRTYQLWYRDSDLSFCTSATFNLTNALTLAWH